MMDETMWGIREEPQGFSITRNGEAFMGWYLTEDDAKTAIQELREGRSLTAMLVANAERKTLRRVK